MPDLDAKCAACGGVWRDHNTYTLMQCMAMMIEQAPLLARIEALEKTVAKLNRRCAGMIEAGGFDHV